MDDEEKIFIGTVSFRIAVKAKDWTEARIKAEMLTTDDLQKKMVYKRIGMNEIYPLVM
jgi:hypothetical protein